MFVAISVELDEYKQNMTPAILGIGEDRDEIWEIMVDAATGLAIEYGLLEENDPNIQEVLADGFQENLEKDDIGFLIVPDDGPQYRFAVLPYDGPID